MKKKTIDIIKALLELISQATFTLNSEGARRLTTITSVAVEHVAALEVVVAEDEEAPSDNSE